MAAQTRDHRRRWPLAVAGAVLLMVCLVSLWWFFWVPNWRPHLHEGERFGVDVSSHQGVVNWREVAGGDIGFAYIKASEGGDFEDSRFALNWRGAAETGLDRGAYHFFTLCTGGVAQGHHFLSVAPPDHDALPPAVDLELAGNCKDRPTPGDVANELSQFLAIVEEAWHTPAVLYVGDDFEHRYHVRDKFERNLWYRRFLRRPDVKNWTIWQLHGYAHVSGIKGGVDLDVMRPNP